MLTTDFVNIFEFQSKTYDSVTEKYLDFSFEKTNSAYMLFYERRLPEHLKEKHAHLLASPTPSKSPQKSTTNDSTEKEIERTVKPQECDEAPTKMEVVTDDLEKSNCDSNSKTEEQEKETETPSTSTGTTTASSASMSNNKLSEHFARPQLCKELEDWIWQDNRQFLQDRNIFEHTYFK